MYQIRRIYDLAEAAGLLEDNHLYPPERTDYTIGVYDGIRLIATGSLTGNIINCLATQAEYANEGIINTVVSDLLTEAQERGIFHLFLFTKPENQKKMESLGFKYVARGGDHVVLLEQGLGGIESYKDELREYRAKNGFVAGSIVMNLNPLTNGHLYLIKKASEQCDRLFIFVVEEDLSYFPFEIRMKLIKEETQEMKNITLLPSGKYIISAITFPSYFLKKADVALAQASLDVNIFANHIAPSLNITKRFAGQEPYCELTSIYNQCMREILPKAGVEFHEIERLKADGRYISASYVRQLASLDRFEEIKRFVPESTYRYLTSEQGRELIQAHILP